MTAATLPADRATLGFARLAAGFERAAQLHADALSTFELRIAGRPVLLRIAGRSLAAELPLALSHLAEPVRLARPQLRIDLWDGEETGVECEGELAPPEASERVDSSGDGRFVLHRVGPTATGLDRGGQRLVGWVRSHRLLTQYDRGRPLHALLLLWHMDRGLQVMHAGLVTRRTRGVLIGGPSGAGKSTVALACLQAGFRFLADDCIALGQTEDGSFRGYSLYGSAHVTADHLRRFPVLSSHGIPGRLPGEDKSLLLLSRLLPDRLSRTAEISVIVLPRVAGAERCTATPAPKRDALLRLAPSTLCWLSHAGERERTLAALARMIGLVPAFWLDLGGEPDGIPALIDRLVTGGGGP